MSYSDAFTAPNPVVVQLVILRSLHVGSVPISPFEIEGTLTGMVKKNVERLRDLDLRQIHLCSNEPGSERGKRNTLSDGWLGMGSNHASLDVPDSFAQWDRGDCRFLSVEVLR